MTELEQKLIDALKKDFNNLYVKDFTTHWREDRMLRGCELDVMSLENTLKLIRPEAGKDL